ncbi:hypothetical protein C8R45DRAFT_957715 [Mycena sanguinolenta]|nr:hypothetical protein C8R45DRAFT_957715 [Mycena sanguinolenta]
MHRGMSYRKPVPVYIPSPPPSPSTSQTLSAGRTPENVPPLPEHWHDAIALARRTYGSNLALSASQTLVRPPEHGSSDSEDVHSGSMHPEPLTFSPEEAHQLPRVASPVHFASNFRNTAQYRVYRPPTPPRPSDHKWRGLFDESPSESRRSKSVCRSEEMYAWSIGTPESYSYSRHASSTSLPSSEWQVTDEPKGKDSNSQERDQSVWWDKLKSLGVLIKNRIRKYGACCG